ncbi:hypothetical protein AKJ16_DCAP02665 [Drosera capensis]
MNLQSSARHHVQSSLVLVHFYKAYWQATWWACWQAMWWACWWLLRVRLPDHVQLAFMGRDQGSMDSIGGDEYLLKMVCGVSV